VSRPLAGSLVALLLRVAAALALAVVASPLLSRAVGGRTWVERLWPGLPIVGSFTAWTAFGRRSPRTERGAQLPCLAGISDLARRSGETQPRSRVGASETVFVTCLGMPAARPRFV
jgi:hypothetical protein